MSDGHRFLITRRIGIDAGHRIMRHGSKCRHIHGHRYEVEAICHASSLHQGGEQDSMVLDFGFLKEEMMAVIDASCDHGFIAEMSDTDLLSMFCPAGKEQGEWMAGLQKAVARDGFAVTTNTHLETRLYIIPEAPTAEALARHWYQRLQDRVQIRSEGLAVLERIVVWETPNCRAEYSEQKTGVQR
ncbi:6-carboxytetrahydropterin synthase [Haematospirillum sp. H1815]|uniref:6-carboxytetrahydropterin synthase n=1 Tax=Haematospirillum sp. H1815 TaxID=2723108 RepID=UPI00143A576C|nr:6-carboxytetrahydropterin synthase [Haematospirillum sp. H1815]NKD77548.1 6-carboxytetrahydropterin synthase [Haematospirillum sp. H1815]